MEAGALRDLPGRVVRAEPSSHVGHPRRVGWLRLGSIWHSILTAVNLINPIGYFPFWEFDDKSSALREFFGYGLTIDTLALGAIAILGVVIAMARWRRLEA